MARSDPQFNLRIPQELKEQIEKSAKDDGRSVNAQAVHLLQVGLENRQQKPPTQYIDITDALTDIMKEIQSLKKPLD
ncbi:Arc family DNA-binding protein [Moraxella bovis]|uniref:Arc family DNA-binding protein n=1 Tax=Moraxella bovis TaxID=476 RepID=A0AAQ2SZP6_MORBO|nr:Arc family DNA-binding protein [Moraxella bovis]AWY19961.1 Arc family DNA-binding protein [Moraxella bovis]OOR87175.1 hypothetical protein B0182_13045 [Moraxella bovis]UYZ74897.1 Arc family DNA-binding protein [Moraxella bovis]UYZ79175.1 Arc family DNA-binding protein [Moraxella bovis]UYZ80243.1 Arc family DNA-binding protein [Moraxella bovis]